MLIICHVIMQSNGIVIIVYCDNLIYMGIWFLQFANA